MKYFTKKLLRGARDSSKKPAASRRKGRGRLWHTSVESLEPRYLLDSTAVINELMYHPRVEDGPEWIELHNQQGVDLDISGWQLGGGVEFTFPEATIMDGGGHLVVSANPATSGIADALGPYVGSLANNGEEILLLNNNGRVMDALDYGDNEPWPAEADGTGATLAKVHVNLGSDDPANWTHSPEVGGTPGAVNFPGDTVTFVNVDFIPEGAAADVHIPTDDTLGSDWTAPDYVLGSQGESWTNEETSVGFFIGDQGETYEESVLADNPLAYWRFSETDTQSAATNLGTLGAAVNGTYSAAALVGADSLIGEAGDHALGISPEDTEPPFRAPGFEKVGENGRTTEFWVSVDALPTADVNLVGDGESAFDFGMVVILRNTGQIRIGLRTNVPFPGWSFYNTERELNVGEVVHVVSIWDAATGVSRTYLDGVEAVQVGLTGPWPTGDAVDTSNAVFVGRDGRTTQSLPAKIDEVAFYDYVLGDDRVAAHFDAGGPEFSDLVITELPGMFNSSSSAYLRKDFTVPGNVDLERITLSVQYDDAFVAYVDGVEVARRNVVGAVAFDSTASSSRSFAVVRQTEDIQLIAQLGDLQPGTHTLAIHGINVAIDDQDFLINYELSGFGVEIPETAVPTVNFNEISAATATIFQIELRNESGVSADLQNYRLVLDGDVPREFAFSSQMVPAGGLVSFTESDLGFRPTNGDGLYLYNASKSMVLDARRVTNRLRGRSEEQGDRWLYPDIETPGTANSFDTSSDIVINEVLYHPPLLRATPAITDDIEIAAFDIPWRYNNTGADLGAGWQNTTHAVDDVNWFQGVGPVGRTGDTLPVPLGTQWPSLDFFDTTYYFQTEITYNGTPEGFDFALSHMIDDGAIIYVNGEELLRVRMPEGAVTAATRATEIVANASIDDPVVISDELFVIGQNTISVEVHMAQTISTEAVMGLALNATKFLSPALPTRESDEQWIELYNRGEQPVDLTGWSFADGINYDLPPDTIVAPGEYLVLSNDAATLAEKYPTVRILGDFGGNVSRAGERIELVDARGNPVDVVHFREGGRWDGLADGGGSSLELRDPHADNSVPESWRASDETDGGVWQTITYRGRATSTGGPTNYNELVLGLLDSGEVLLDDISVIEDPSGTARQLIQNGGFESDAVGDPAGSWRIIGTHEQSHVIVDPDDPNNQVLRLIATNSTEHMHNHAETTLKFENTFVTINSSREYEISFRAKWLSGTDLFNSRLYFNRLARTTMLETPKQWGTPGSQNSVWETNIGPTYADLSHAPTVPEPNQDVIVSVTANDPDGIGSMELYYSIDGDEFATVAMSNSGGDRYTGVIPAQVAGTIVQFYVEGTDTEGAVSTFPADGAASRALYVVEDGKARDFGNHNFRIVMTTADANRLHEVTNVMSNARLGGTVIYDESEVYYDIGVRLKGSERGRNQSVRVGFNLRFDPLQLFRGAHRTVGIDRSGSGNEYSQEEVLVKQTMNHAGGVTDLYDDFIYLIAPRNAHTGSALLQMARYKDIFLDSQYENGSDGQLFKYELIYYPTTTTGGPEGLKRPEPDQVTGVGLRSRGDDQEAYRWYFLNRNNIAEDDYSGLIEALKVMGLSGNALHEQSREVLDVDQWLRSFAVQTLWGVGDNYVTGAQHNAYFYIRPSDGKMLYLPWDVDFTGTAGATSSLVQNGDLTKMLTLPENEHYYYGHIHDIVTTSFNNSYMNPWVDHYNQFSTSTNLNGFKGYISTRSQFALNTINNRFSNVNFAVTTNGGADLTVMDSEVTLAGNGWINVREIRLDGNAVPLNISWPTATGWQVTLPVSSGENVLALQAYDLQGNLIGTDSITVTSTADNPVVDSLRISEINYHPHDPTAAELSIDAGLEADDFEFMEFVNIGSDPINPVGATFADGLEFTFPSIEITPGELVVVARNVAAFQIRYGSTVTPIGEFDSGQLGNGGEHLAVATALGETILDFSYADNAPWPESADGIGGTLEVIDVENTPADQYGRFQVWRGSTTVGGTPGTAGVAPIGVVINEVLASSTPPQTPLDSIELLNTTDGAIDIGGWFLSDASDRLFKYEIPAETILDAGEYLVISEDDFNPTPDSPGPNDFALSGSRGDDVWVVIPDGAGGIASFVDHVQFGATPLGLTLGREPSVSTGLAPLSRPTLGCANLDVRAGSIVISEINHNPGIPSGAALAIDPTLTADDLEFIEIYNATTEAVDLTEWRIRGGADYDFVSGQMIASGETLVVVTFNPAAVENTARADAFRAHYGIDDSVTLVGGLAGQLSDAGEEIDLQRLGTPPLDDPTVMPRISEELLFYDNVAPWPDAANGTGMSLTRSVSVRYGNDGASWSAEVPSPGTTDFDFVLVGDLNASGAVGAEDIDVLLDEVRAGRSLSFFDLDGNDVVNANDVSFLVQNVLGTRVGDANLDQSVDAVDFGIWNDHRFSNCQSWTTGDFSGDGAVDGTDFNFWNANKFFSQPAAAASRRVPRMPLVSATVKIAVPDRDEALRAYLADRDTGIEASAGVTDGEAPRHQRASAFETAGVQPRRFWRPRASHLQRVDRVASHSERAEISERDALADGPQQDVFEEIADRLFADFA